MTPGGAAAAVVVLAAVAPSIIGFAIPRSWTGGWPVVCVAVLLVGALASGVVLRSAPGRACWRPAIVCTVGFLLAFTAFISERGSASGLDRFGSDGEGMLVFYAMAAAPLLAAGLYATARIGRWGMNAVEAARDPG